MSHPFVPLETRFWSKVEKTDGCWLWTANRGDCGTGYGQISEGGKHGRLLSAHRVSWEMHFGPVPFGVQVLHSCDNRSCVRPDHLFLGSQADNVVDMVRKRRHYNLKLSPEAVREIRALRLSGIPASRFAARFGICAAHARKVARSSAWRHVR